MVGIGGAGCRILDRMIDTGMQGVSFIAIDSDPVDLSLCQASDRVQLVLPPPTLTRGKKAVSRMHYSPADFAEAVTNQSEEIRSLFAKADMVVVVTGLGGGTGSVAAPLVARLARDAGILTVGVVTTPFEFEGAHRCKTAQTVIQELINTTDTLIHHSCHDLLRLIDSKISLQEAFLYIDDLARLTVLGFTDLFAVRNLICISYLDIKAIFTEAGKAYAAVGECAGANRARLAVRQAISNLPRATMIRHAKGILVNITGDPDLALIEATEAMTEITNQINPETNIIFGVQIDPKMTDELRITLIVT